MVRVFAIDQNGKQTEYPSVKKAATALGVSYETIVRRAADGMAVLTYCGPVRVDFEEFAKGAENTASEEEDNRPVRVLKYDCGFVADYPSVFMASKATKCDVRTIRRHIESGKPIRTNGLMFDYA